MSSFGFTYLSRRALGQAEQAMLGNTAGVRDEVGFLIIHQRYSDRFFPGTSVLHTRLRYALLIPLAYQSLREKRPIPKDFAQAFKDLEGDLTRRLNLSGEDGVIGGQVYPRESSQPPSYVYWTALTKWGLIGTRPGGRPWGRSDMAKLLAAAVKKAPTDDDGKPFETSAWPIADLGNLQSSLLGTGELTFKLSDSEKKFLATKLRSVRSPIDPSESSLLSKLVGHSLGDIGNCWDRKILKLAGKEKAAMKRAGQAAALSGIGRAVYAALVETLKEERDERPQQDRHRLALIKALELWEEQAVGLDLEPFFDDIGTLSPTVRKLLCDTYNWIRSDDRDPMSLLDVYRLAEKSRKGDRARLADNQFGIDRRVEWQAENHSSAEPLHYRWGNVKRLLEDLEGVE